MGKKKTNSRAKRKAAAQKEAEKQKTVETGTVKDMKKETEKKTEQSEQLSVYTATAMLEALITAAATVVAMVVSAKPSYYLLDALFRKQYGEENSEIMNVLYFKDTEVLRLAETCMLIAGILLGIATIGAIIVVVRAADAAKKPQLWINIVDFLLSIVALGLFIYSGYQMLQEINTHDFMSTFTQDSCFNIYMACFVAMIVNTIGALVNIFASMSGLKKWKKQGTAY